MSILFFLILISIIPLMFGVWSTVKIIGRIKNRQPLGIKYFIFLFVSLFLVDFFLCLPIFLQAMLGHGRSAGTNYYLQCFLSFMVVVVVPLAGLILCRFYPRRLLLLIYFILYAVLLGFIITSTTPGTSAALRDEKGRPVAGAYVFYSMIPAQNGPSGYYGFTRSDASGKFTVSRKIHFQVPFQYYPPLVPPAAPAKIEICIYARQLQNYSRIEDGYKWHFPAEPKHLKIEKTSPEPVLVLYDMSGQPEHLYYALYQLYFGTPIIYDRNPLQEKQELVSLMKQEYNAFVSQYGEVLREADKSGFVWMPSPAMIPPAGEKKPWRFYLKNELGQTFEDRMNYVEPRLSGYRP